MRKPPRAALGLLTLLAWTLAPVSTPAQAPPPGPGPRPNFVFFLTDDQRADALSIAGHPLLKTPNIDRIGREGVRFANAFVTNALCTPSRACILTGKYGHTTGVTENGQGKAALRPTERIFPERLREAGYEVAFIGKSHLSGNLRDRAWDTYFGFQGQGRYVDPIIAENGGPDLVRKGYMDDVLGDKAVEFLERPHPRPFCLFVWFKAPHRSWVRAPRYQALYEGQAVPEPPTFRAGYEGKPRAVAGADMKIGTFADVKSLDQLVKDYCATIAAVDDNVGKVLGALDRKGLAQDTAVLYSSDNGFFLGEWNFFDKRLMYEPSIRVPLLVRYPRRVAPGGVRSEMALNLDFAATILDLAGLPVPADTQGKSLTPLLLGQSPPWRDAWLYEYFEYPEPHRVRPHRGVRTDRYKLIHFHGEPQEWELYDLAADPNETTNLYPRPEHAATVATLKRRLDDLRRETGDPDLGKN